MGQGLPHDPTAPHGTQQAAEAATFTGSSAEARLSAIESQQPKQTWQPQSWCSKC